MAIGSWSRSPGLNLTYENSKNHLWFIISIACKSRLPARQAPHSHLHHALSDAQQALPVTRCSSSSSVHQRFSSTMAANTINTFSAVRKRRTAVAPWPLPFTGRSVRRLAIPLFNFMHSWRRSSTHRRSAKFRTAKQNAGQRVPPPRTAHRPKLTPYTAAAKRQNRRIGCGLPYLRPAATPGRHKQTAKPGASIYCGTASTVPPLHIPRAAL
ncbi:hypothetical protein NPIL_180341, partial [Nephila pilipes]